MEFTKLGNSDIEISRFCVGCMSFGDPASKMHEWTLNPQESDMEIVRRVSELAEKKDATMTQIALAWQFAKGVAAPIIGATKAKYLSDAVRSFDVKLKQQEITYLEEAYIPHNIVGAL